VENSVDAGAMTTYDSVTQRKPEGGRLMATLSVRVSDELKRILEARAKGQHRQLSDQARRYLEIGLIAEDNPDLSFAMIEAILEAKAELDAGLAEPYPFDDEPSDGAVQD